MPQDKTTLVANANRRDDQGVVDLGHLASPESVDFGFRDQRLGTEIVNRYERFEYRKVAIQTRSLIDSPHGIFPAKNRPMSERKSRWTSTDLKDCRTQVANGRQSRTDLPDM